MMKIKQHNYKNKNKIKLILIRVKLMNKKTVKKRIKNKKII